MARGSHLDRDVVERAVGLTGEREFSENGGGGQRRLECFAKLRNLRDLSGHGEVECGFVTETELAFQFGADQVGLQLDFDGGGHAVHHRLRVFEFRLDAELQVVGETFGVEGQRLVERLHVGREVEVAQRLELLFLAVIEGDMASLDADIAQRCAH